MMRRLALCLLLLFPFAPAIGALHFPALTAHVVDDAHALSPRSMQALDQKLAEYEQGTTNQVVVAILPGLEGTSVEDYGNQLFRHWALGQKGKDNGILLLVAPHERKIRIEVGYGLEGTLTDAQSSQIIHGIMLPAFKAGNMEEGIVQGADAILAVLGGNGARLPEPAQQPISGLQLLFIMIILIFFIRFAIRNPVLAYMLLSNVRMGGSSGGSGWSGGGGGWSGGGGGSSGGGGASGSW